jgi:hypothetical protein
MVRQGSPEHSRRAYLERFSLKVSVLSWTPLIILSVKSIPEITVR